MVEMRPQFNGFYKGFIYCSEINEAFEIADYLETVILRRIGVKVPVTVKRGCSEYALSFPFYKNVSSAKGQLMTFPTDWKAIEDEFDFQHDRSKTVSSSSLLGFHLADVMVICNWIDYANGIGDPCMGLLNQEAVVSKKIYEIAKRRVKKYPFLAA